MSSTVTYKGSTIASVSNTTKTLETAGKYMEDDVTIVDVSQATPVLQTVSKSYTPSETAQSEDVTAGSGYDGLEKVSVSVGAISSSYVGSGISRRSSDNLSASGATVTAAAGYYESAASKTIASGSVTAPATISGTSATVSTGTNTLTLSKTVSVTPSVTTAGYVSSGTAGNSSVSLTASVNTRTSANLSASGDTVTAPAGYYAASASKAVASGSATAPASISSTGATVSTSGTSTLTLSKSNVSVTPTVSAGYVSSGTAGNSTVSLSASVNIRTSSNLSASGDTVTAPAGYYASSASKAVSAGTAGTPTATKGTVSNHSVSVTPSVTNTTGYITGSTKTGTAVTVSASELDSGTKSISSNGTGIDVVGYAAVDVNVSGTQAGTVYQDNDGYLVLDDGAGSHIQVDSLSVTTNGTYTASSGHAYSPVVVNVSGGGGVEEKQVNFYDYDGTCLHSFTAAEWANESALPSNPTHTGLTAQGWNWTKEEIDNQLLAFPLLPVAVGQCYLPSSGKTEIDIVLNNPDELSPYLCIAPSGTVTVDWGDSSTPDTITGSSTTTNMFLQHVYSQTGSYTISLATTGGYTLGYASSSNSIYAHVLFSVQDTSSKDLKYCKTIKSMRIASNCYSYTYGFGQLGLETVTIPNYFNTQGVFADCHNLKAIVIPRTGGTIYQSMFSDCYSLEKVILHGTAGLFYRYAFQRCYALKTITIPNRPATRFGNSAFSNCKSLTEIGIPAGTYADSDYAGEYLFEACDSLARVYIKEGPTETRSNYFTNCKALSGIEFPSTMTTLTGYSFNNCYSLTKITIPINVTSIGYGCFQSAGLMEIHVLPTTPPTLGSGAITTWSGMVIYVPYSADHSILNAYQTASNWSSFASYMQEEPQ